MIIYSDLLPVYLWTAKSSKFIFQYLFHLEIIYFGTSKENIALSAHDDAIH